MNLKAVVATIAMAAIVSSSMVSCSQEFDDTAIWDEIDKIKKEIAALREMVETEFFALNELVNGLVTVKDVNHDKNGNTIVTLSDGTKITIYPKADKIPENIVTVVTETVDDESVMYWAIYDGTGTAKPIYVDGKKVPVADVVPQTQIEGDAIQVSFDGGNTWVTTGYNESVADSVFDGIEVVYSDWQKDDEGNPLPLYCIFTMNDGSTLKVGMQHSRIILPYDSIFVPYGSKIPFKIENVEDAADYMVTTPKGWECETKLNTKDNSITINFIAPTRAAIDANEAAIEGVVKLMVVYNNGSSAIASIKVTCNPITVHFTADSIYLEAGYGTSYLLHGITTPDRFITNTLKGECDKILGNGTSDYVSQHSFMEEDNAKLPYTNLTRKNEALVAGTEYVYWYVSPRSNANGDLYVVENEIFSQPFTHSTVDLKVNEADFFDVDVTFTTVGSQPYILNLVPSEEFDAEALAAHYTEYPELLIEDATFTQTDPYTGSLSQLFGTGLNLTYNTKYTAYYIAKSHNNIIIKENVRYWEVTTKDFTRGGNIEVVVEGEPEVEYKSIKMTLNSKTNNHIAMFYNAMPSYQAASYTTDDSIITMLTSKDALSEISSNAVNALYEGADPGTKLTFFAVAVDTEGKFGKPFKKEFTTKEFKYNDLAVTLDLVSYKIDDTRIKPTCEGAKSYRYLYISTKDELWTNTLNKNIDKAGEYMQMYPTSSNVYNTSDSNNALVEGSIFIKGLVADTEYVAVVMAVDSKGGVSKPVACYFTPIANIGNVVTSDKQQWIDSKPTVTILNTETVGDFYSMSWSCLPTKDTKIYTAAMYPANFINDELGSNIDTIEELIAAIIKECDTGKMSEAGKSFEWQESGIYIREWVEWEDTDGDNYLEEVTYSEERNAPYIFFPYGSEGTTFIYTTWVGKDGNFCEPFAVDPATKKEAPLWGYEK